MNRTQNETSLHSNTGYSQPFATTKNTSTYPSTPIAPTRNPINIHITPTQNSLSTIQAATSHIDGYDLYPPDLRHMNLNQPIFPVSYQVPSASSLPSPGPIFDTNEAGRNSIGTSSLKNFLPSYDTNEDEDEEKINKIMDDLEIQRRLKEGTENLLIAAEKAETKSRNKSDSKNSLREEAEYRLDEVNRTIHDLQLQLDGINSKRALKASQQQQQQHQLSRQQTNQASISTFQTANYTLGNQSVNSLAGLNISSTTGNNSTFTSSKNENGYHYDNDDDDYDQNLEFDQGDPTSPTFLLGDILQSLGDKDRDADYLVQRANDLITVLQNNPQLKHDLNFAAVGNRIQSLLLKNEQEVAAAGYRLARYSIVDFYSLKPIKLLRMDYFIVRSLAKDTKCQVEKEQAIKLIRAFLDVQDGASEITVSMIRSLAAIADQTDDKLRYICIETLAEIFIMNPEVVFKGGGVKIMIQCATEGPRDLASICTMSFLSVLDKPEARRYLRGGYDMRYLITTFTDIQTKGHVNIERLQNSAFLLTGFLKTWPGLISFAFDNFWPIQCLVNCLHYSIPVLRDVIMDIVSDILRIRKLPWLQKANGKGSLSYAKQFEDKSGEPNSGSGIEYRALNHFMSLLLFIFIKCDITTLLISIIEENSDTLNSSKAMLLLSEMANLASNVLPLEVWKNKFTFPSLVELSLIGPEEGEQKPHYMVAIYRIEKITKMLNKAKLTAPKGSHGATRSISMDPSQLPNTSTHPTTNSIIEPRKPKTEEYAATASKNLQAKLNYEIDDTHFKQSLGKTLVLTTKSSKEWDWKELTEFVQGPLRNPKRLEEVIKSTKFMKRLMSFYRPFKYRFSAIKRTKSNLLYIRLGKELFKTLLCCDEGARYLSENKLLRQIAECLAQLDPTSGISSADPLFSEQRLDITISYGYFAFLGVLSAHKNGIIMMERWRMFNMIYHIVELEDRNDLKMYFISSFDYSLVSHPRIILSKILTIGNESTRLFATKHLRKLLESQQNVKTWAVKQLVTQLYDPSIDVCNLAVQILYEFCRNDENMHIVIKSHPSLDQLGFIGSPLLLRFLSTSEGFQYLKEINYVDEEMNSWFNYKNSLYAHQVEMAINREYYSLEPDKKKYGFLVTHHFFGELVKTEEGCQLLTRSGNFGKMCSFVRQNSMESKDQTIITQLKGCLWAIGHIGSSKLGISYLEASGIIEEIIGMCQNSEVWSLKGVAYFALGLISSTFEGMEILEEFDWLSVSDSIGNPKGYCIPLGMEITSNIKKEDLSIISDDIKITDDQLIETNVEQTDTSSVLLDPIQKKIIIELSNLSNHMLATNAAKELSKLESKNRDKFESPELFMEAMKLLEKYRYRHITRRFIVELFNRSKTLERTIKRDKRRSREQTTNGLRTQQKLSHT